MLKHRADLRTLTVVALYFSSVVLGWLYFPEEWYLRLAVVVVVSTFSFMCAVITHNTIHVPMFKQAGWNRFFQVVLSFTYGHSVSAYVPGHNFSHHQHTQTPRDRIRTDKMRFRWNLLNQLFFFFRMAPGIMKDENAFAKRMMKEHPRWFAQYVLELVLVIGVKVALIVVDWEKGLLLLVIPHFYAAWGIVGTNFWQHDGCDETHPYNHTRNFTGKLLNFFAFNNGYHSAHHDVPHLHWSLLPAYHQEKIAPHIHPNLNRVSLLSYLWEMHIWPGKRLDYLGNPLQLPPKRDDADWMDGLDIRSNPYALGVEGLPK
jgi:fatty acid desaturase